MSKLTPAELSEIQREAHKIHQRKPRRKYSDCVKEAGKTYCKKRSC